MERTADWVKWTLYRAIRHWLIGGALVGWAGAVSADGLSKLEEAARATPDDAKTIYAIGTVPLYLAAKATNESQGNVMPSAPVDVIGREGDFFHVRVSGWQQEGVDRIAYYAPGRRIPSALFRPETIGKLKRGEVKKDGETGQAWTLVEVDAYVPRDKFVADVAPIWSYGAELMSANCATCHTIAMDKFTANQWTGVMKSMQSRTTLSPEQMRVLTQYAQKHGSDMADVKK